MKQPLKYRTAESRGASAVELAIIIPIAILMIGVVIDLARAFALYAALNYAAHRAATNFAATPVEESVIEPAILDRYIGDAERFLTSTFFRTTPSAAQLVGFQQPGLPATTPRYIVLLRPSESAPRTVGAGLFSHPIATGPTPSRPWSKVLSLSPFAVHAEADITFIFLPGFTRRISATAYAYRRSRNTYAVSGNSPTSGCPWCPPTTPTPPTSPTPPPTPSSGSGGGGSSTPPPTPTPVTCPCMATNTCCAPFTLGCCQGGN